DGSLNVSGIEFITAGACFASGATASGSLMVTTTNNVVTGPLSFVVQSGTPPGNTLTLTGTENGTVITGTWTLAGGSDCNESTPEPFTMCQGTGACTPTTT
ncbi:MAG: hypothetical protein WCA16_18470, partial [Candidatus Sulfotelmatobacter sp.]